MKKLVFLPLLIGLATNAALAQSDVLDGYVREGLERSPAVRQQQFVLQKSLAALYEARGLYRPTVAFNTTYSTAQGGRTLFFPVGDLINPLYYKTGLAPMDSKPIPNVDEQLVPKNFYDMRVKTSMPLVNAEIKYNRLIRQQQVGVQEVEIQLLKRELVKEIKVAYFNFLKAAEAVRIYENARGLLLESQRVNQALVTNQMANPTVLLRSRNEIGKMDADIAAAEATRQNAAAYLNYLLTRDLAAPVTVDTTFRQPVFTEALTAGTREELDGLRRAVALSETAVQLSQAYRTPRLGLGLDLGAQGFVNDIDLRKNPFWLLGISFDLPIYTGGRNQAKVRQARADVSAAQTQLEQVTNQLALQAETARTSFRSSRQVFESRRLQVETAERYYRDQFRRYREGQTTFIELLDAQTQITTANLQQVLALYDVWIRLAELERALAAYPVN
jgi:outer membrane protein TolC